MLAQRNQVVVIPWQMILCIWLNQHGNEKFYFNLKLISMGLTAIDDIDNHLDLADSPGPAARDKDLLVGAISTG